MQCDHNQIILYFYGEVSELEQTSIAAHIEKCGPCREFFASLEEVSTSFGQQEKASVKPELSNKIKHSLKSRFVSKNYYLRYALSMAAALLLGICIWQMQHTTPKSSSSKELAWDLLDKDITRVKKMLAKANAPKTPWIQISWKQIPKPEKTVKKEKVSLKKSLRDLRQRIDKLRKKIKKM